MHPQAAARWRDKASVSQACANELRLKQATLLDAALDEPDKEKLEHTIRALAAARVIGLERLESFAALAGVHDDVVCRLDGGRKCAARKGRAETAPARFLRQWLIGGVSCLDRTDSPIAKNVTRGTDLLESLRKTLYNEV